MQKGPSLYGAKGAETCYTEDTDAQELRAGMQMTEIAYKCKNAAAMKFQEAKKGVKDSKESATELLASC